MTGEFHSIDLPIKFEESGSRVECRSSVTLATMTSKTKEIWFIPFESSGLTVFDTYAIDVSLVGDGGSTYGYKLAVYTQYAKLGDTGTTLGVGALVPNTTVTVTGLSGTTNIGNAPSLTYPVTLPQGSYFIAFMPYLVVASAKPSLAVATTSGIACNSLTWMNQSHMYGTVNTSGTLPNLMTTATDMASLGGTFASSKDSMWACVFDSRNTYP